MNLPWTDREHKSPQNSASFNSFSREFGGIGEGGRARNVHEFRARGAARKTIARKKKEKETWGEGGEDGEKERDNAKKQRGREGGREGEGGIEVGIDRRRKDWRDDERRVARSASAPQATSH